MREATGGGAAGASSSSAASVPMEVMEMLPMLRTKEGEGRSTLNYPPGDLDIVFWCPPGKTISEIMAVGFEVDCLKMAEASVISKMFVLFVKHVKTTEIEKLEEEEDDIAYRAVPELPEVILSPISKDKMRPVKSDSNKASAESGENSEIPDALDEDDELYDKNVDDAVQDALVEKGKKVGAEYKHVPGIDDVTEEERQLLEEDDFEKMHESDSDDEEYKKKKKKEKPIYRFKTFNPLVEMENPQFKLGMVFDSVESLRKAIAHYAVKNRVQSSRS
ncbi:hypothetical protein D1007_43183 [Hordeum vulgare]|nr:hypothetical protein D1007_43183 [Hordeum vulgare]